MPLQPCPTIPWTVLTGFRSPDELEHPPAHVQRYTFRHSDIFHNMDHALFVSPDPALTGLINTASTRIGDVADCVTGFYSGDDRRFLRVLSDCGPARNPLCQGGSLCRLPGFPTNSRIC